MAQNVIKQKVNKKEIVDEFFERQNQKKEFDPQFERKLNQHRRGTSFENKTQNIWMHGDYAEEEDEKMDNQRSQSINVILPDMDCMDEDQANKVEMLSKAEKK